MNWTCVSLFTDPKNADMIGDLLVTEDIYEFSVMNPEEFSQDLRSSVYYDYVEDKLLEQKDAVICIYAPRNGQGEEKLQKIRRAVEQAGQMGLKVRMEFSGLQEEDWMNNWKKYFKPTKIGEKMLIKPSWEPLPQTGDRIVLEIDPSSSFGTGTHETTRLCIEALETMVHPGDEVLDMGCGSGILSVAAALLGAKSVTGVDIEEDSIRVSKENAARNGLSSEKVRLFLGNVLQDEALADRIADRAYDVIAANIVADVIKAMTPLFFRYLRPGGTIVCSGIIIERAEEVRAVLCTGGLQILELKKAGEWAAILARKPE